MEYDPYSYEIDVDPYPVYRWMRDEVPVYRNERLGFWALTRFDDVRDALADWETYSSAEGTVLELMGSAIGGSMIIFMDPPAHERMRKLVSRAFTPRAITRMEPVAREVIGEYLDALQDRDDFDAVADFAAPFPVRDDALSAAL